MTIASLRSIQYTYHRCRTSYISLTNRVHLKIANVAGVGPVGLARGWADLIHQYAVKDAGHAALIGRIRSEEMYAQVLSAFQATPRKTIIAENSIHTIKPIAAASPP
jgi:hypothetical protein